MAHPAYASLTKRFERIGTIGEASAMLGWDASAMMPEGGAGARGEQLAVLAGLAHELLTATETGDALLRAAAELHDTAEDGWERRNLALMRRAHARASALPAALVEARARAESECEMVWRGAKADNDFARVKAPLGALLAIVREEAVLLGEASGTTPYDALLDGFQPGMPAARITPIFDRYEAFLREALPQAEAIESRLPPAVALPTPVAADRQERMCRELAGRAGLDWAHARLDRSLHPFCGGTPTDVRITTRYDEDDPSRALMGVLHETGHALYERGLPAAWARQPVGAAAGMAAHESQSLIVEMQACRSDSFLSWLGPELARSFGGHGAPYRPANLRRLWRRVERSFVRVDADELTYPAHVILRYRLERALVAGELQVADLPGAWSDELHRLLGIRPRHDREGCLQDIHWYTGLYGYFPSYSLGAMAAAQLMTAARRADATIDAAIGEGDLGPLTAWLRANVHAHGSRYGLAELLTAATGEALDPAHFELHLRARYLGAVPA